MEEWSEIRIGELGAVITGSTPPTKNPEYYGNEFPFITPTDMGLATRVVRCQRFLSSLGAEYMNSRLLPPGSICFVCIGATIGKTCLTQEISYTNQQVNSLIVDAEKHDPYFVYYLLNYEKDRIKKMAGGTASPIINKTVFSSIKLKVPNKDVQYCIGRILSVYDDLIENNLRRIQILEELARAIYREWFVHFRFPGHEEVEMVDSELGGIPEGWNVDSFSSLAYFQNGFAFKPTHWQEKGLPIVKIAEMKNGFGSTTKHYHGNDIDEKFHIESGDLLFAWSASLFVCFWTKGDALLNQHIFLVNPRRSYSKYLIHSMLQEALPRFQSLAQGTTMRHIKRSALDDVKTVIPPEHLRDVFDKSVESLIQISWNLHKQNETLQEMRNLLLPRLVSGEIDVSEIEIKVSTSNTRKTSKYKENQSTLVQWLDGDEEDGCRK